MLPTTRYVHEDMRVPAALFLSSLLVLLSATTSRGPLAVAGPPEGPRHWAGLLPDPKQEASRREGYDGEWFATRVLDAQTLEPIPGARWIRTPERVNPWSLHHDAIMDVALSDADGIAHMRAAREIWSDDCHWLVQSPGYAVAHDYGKHPEPETLLERSVVMRGSILDPLGRAVVNARVEFLGGCSHGTAAARAVTGVDGRFTLHGVAASLPGQLWIEGAQIASDLLALDDPDSLGAAGVQIVMEPGLRYQGRLVDLAGEPVQGAVVRAWNAQRGPTAMSDAHGRFVIAGVAPDSNLVVFAPGDLLDEDGARQTSDCFHEVPCRLVVSPRGLREEEATCRVQVRAVRADGGVEHDVSYRLLNLRTGLGPWGMTSAEASDEEVPPGTYRVLPDEPFAAVVFDPTEVQARVEAVTSVTLAVRPNPRLTIKGTLPEDVQLALAVPRAEITDALDGTLWRPFLPAGGPAVLRVEAEGRPPFFFPIGPTKEGTRTVHVQLPLPRRIGLPREAKEVTLWDGERTAVGYRAGDTFLTDATGRLTLRWEDAEGRTRELPVDLPSAAGAEVILDEASARPLPGLVRLTALKPGEARPPEGDWETASPGEVVAFEREGWRRLRAVAPPKGETILRWGQSTLRLRIRGLEDPLVLVGGEIYEAPGGTLTLQGFESGPLRIVVAPRDTSDNGLELEVVLGGDGVTEAQVSFDED